MSKLDLTPALDWFTFRFPSSKSPLDSCHASDSAADEDKTDDEDEGGTGGSGKHRSGSPALTPSMLDGQWVAKHGLWTYDAVRRRLVNWRNEKQVVLSQLDDQAKITRLLRTLADRNLDAAGFMSTLERASMDVHSCSLSVVLDEHRRTGLPIEWPDPSTIPTATTPPSRKPPHTRHSFG